MFSSNTSQVASTGSALAEAIDFDGTNDWLSRSTDFTGNTDSKTFTFSAWIWYPTETAAQYVFTSGQGFEVTVRSTTGGSYIQILGRNAAGTTILSVNARSTTSPAVNASTFYHLLVSVDLTNTSARGIYINDVAVTPTWLDYTNDNIDFTLSANNISVAASRTGGNKYKGRLSNVFLDYTYRGLFVAARRLFVTADLKPAAGQAALNPVLYLPLNDPTNPGLNQGTGGNFTLTGTVARSGRGPNQYNAPYSDLNGSSGYLYRGLLTGATNTKTVTFSGCFNFDSLSITQDLLGMWSGSGTTIYANIRFSSSTTSRLRVDFSRATGGAILVFTVPQSALNLAVGRNHNLLFSVDLNSTSNRKVFIDGVDITASVTWTAYTNDSIGFNVMNPVTIGCIDNTAAGGGPQNLVDGRVGAVWLNNSYVDLSVAANVAKFVTGTGINSKPVDLGASGELPTGTSPLMYLPMYGNNAGKNYGTGGDFAVSNGPYLGSRGPNEFFGNKADFALADGYLSRSSALVGVSNGKVFSFSGWFSFDAAKNTAYTIFEVRNATPDVRFTVQLTSSETLRIQGLNSAGTSVLIATNATVLTANTQYYLQVCIDLTDTGKRFVYLNGTALTMTWTTYSNDDIEFAAPNVFMGGTLAPTFSSPLDGKLSELYFTTSYIDFSQEANRLKFRDAFGNPVNLTQQIEDAAIPNPAVYMRFPPTAFGTNYGTGGNFTVNGTITDGGQL